MGFMKRIRRVVGAVPERTLERIPIGMIFSDDIAYQGQNFAGRPIAHFPMVEIFQLYERSPEEAHERFESWMREWLLDREGWKISKLDGGMAEGSLFQEIFQRYEEIHGEAPADFQSIDCDIVTEAIEARAKYYFVDVFESIRDNGYDKTVEPPITYTKEEGRFVLKNGHHRAAALVALGHQDIVIGPHEAWT